MIGKQQTAETVPKKGEIIRSSLIMVYCKNSKAVIQIGCYVGNNAGGYR